MKKFIKNNIFGFILGAIIFGSIGVVSAYTVLADNIEYTPSDSTWKKENGEDITNVKDAIDDLYSKAKPEYSGNITFTPTETIQTLNTKNKILKDNLVINAIPSTYKKLTTTTTVSSSNLLNGVTAYDNLGNLITGTISVNNGLTDTINIPSNYSLSSYAYNCGFKPGFIYFEWSNGWTWHLLNNNIYVYQTNDGSSYHIINSGITTSSTGFSLDIANNAGLKGLSAKIYVLK